MNREVAFFGVVLGAAAVIALGATMVAHGSFSAASNAATAPKPAPPPVVATPAPVAPSLEWEFHENNDEMRGLRWWSASLRSSNEVFLSHPYDGGSRAEIVLVRAPTSDRDAARVALRRGQLTCSDSPYNVCEVAVRFDDDPVRTIGGKRNQIGAYDFLELNTVGGSTAIIERIEKARRVVVELPIYRDGRRQFTFDVPGLSWPEARPDLTR